MPVEIRLLNSPQPVTSPLHPLRLLRTLAVFERQVRLDRPMQQSFAK